MMIEGKERIGRIRKKFENEEEKGLMRENIVKD